MKPDFSVLNGTYFKSGNQKISAEGVKILYQSDVPPIAVRKICRICIDY
jgi:hypothetical protein